MYACGSSLTEPVEVIASKEGGGFDKLSHRSYPGKFSRHPPADLMRSLSLSK